MLILTRRVGETLMVGDNVSVTVLGIKGNQVRIGIEAPVNVEIHREEIFQRIQEERNRGQHVKRGNKNQQHVFGYDDNNAPEGEI